jgi:prepilin-type N-terminal cleavage/methylation domain-containing protein
MRNAQRDRADDSGFTLTEVLVGMSILSLFFAIFGGSLISMFHSVDRTQQTAYAQAQANVIFLKLDKQIRYASGLSQPASNVFATGDAVVEFVTSHTGTPVCTEVRLTPAGDLQERTWGQNDVPVVPSAPIELATDVGGDPPSNPAGPNTLVAGPFAVLAPVGDSSVQRLEIAVNTQASRTSATPSRIRHVDVTFSALNTGTSTSSNSVCSQGRSIAWPAS